MRRMTAFSRVPARWVRDKMLPKLGPRPIGFQRAKLLLALVGLSGKRWTDMKPTGWLSVTLDEITDVSHMTKTTVSRELKELADLGFIERDPAPPEQPPRRANRYRFLNEDERWFPIPYERLLSSKLL